MTQNGVSKHVKVLEDAGLVVRRVEGREHWISVGWPALQPAYFAPTATSAAGPRSSGSIPAFERSTSDEQPVARTTTSSTALPTLWMHLR